MKKLLTKLSVIIIVCEVCELLLFDDAKVRLKAGLSKVGYLYFVSTCLVL